MSVSVFCEMENHMQQKMERSIGAWVMDMSIRAMWVRMGFQQEP